MRELASFDLGPVLPDQVHLSRMSSPSDTLGYYFAELVIPLGGGKPLTNK